MSIDQFSRLDLLLAGIGFVLLLLSVFLLINLLNQRKKNVELQKDLDLQRSRVLARKEKIWELRSQIHDLTSLLTQNEEKLVN